MFNLIRTEIIQGKANDQQILEINSTSLYNSLRKNDEILLIIITDNTDFLLKFMANNLYNHIILITNKKKIFNRFMLYAITYCLFYKNIRDDNLVIE